jgi:hypothetical protein
MKFSRDKAQKAQLREVKTNQPKERLSTKTKATITITNYLGGKYFFTIDEVSVNENIAYLIECKHTKYNRLPSKGDIKDGLLKLILYSNLNTVYFRDKEIKSIAVLNLTSDKLVGHISSECTPDTVKAFCNDNVFSESDKQFIDLLFKEAIMNKFIVKIGSIT